MRHALTLFPSTPYFFFLDDHTLIMNSDLAVEDHIMNKARLESLMQADVPIIPPDSVIKTFSHLKGDRIDLVLSQDKEGLLPNSFIVRRGDWAKFFLDAWFDPLYRSYNFQRAERQRSRNTLSSSLPRRPFTTDRKLMLLGGTAPYSLSWRWFRRIL